MPSPRYVGLPEAAVYLGMSEQALKRLVQRRKVPFSQPAGPRTRLLFDLRKLDRWIEAHTTEAVG